MLFTDSLKLDFLCTFVALLIILIVKHQWTLGYWRRRGVVGPGGTFIFGSMKDFFLSKKSMADSFKELYNEYKSKGARYFGFYYSGAPTFVPIDMELIKSVLQTDFQNFQEHGYYNNEKDDPVSSNVFFLDGKRWREIRSKVTPTFTPVKIKMMQQAMIDCCLVLEKLLADSSMSNPVDIKDIMARFTTDVIGSCAFGLDIRSMENPNIEFRIYNEKLVSPSFGNALRFIFPLILSHDILRAIGFRPLSPDISNFYQKIVMSTIKYREENNVIRKDFMNIMINMKNNEDESERLTINEIIGQCFIFYVGGFEASSSAINFATFEITQNQGIQNKLREQIKTVISKHNNELTYEAIQEMEYLDQVVCETLRKYPALPALMRKCSENYKVPGENLEIKKGTLMLVPVSGIHYDPEYYPNPNEFNPDRFSAENRKKIPPYAWIPFGEGPRICLGLRFGMLQVKSGLVSLIRNFKVSLNKKTKLPVEFCKLFPVTKCEQPIWIDLERVSI